MGYRLDIYKNSLHRENNIFYGTKLIGYLNGHEGDLLCIKYLCKICEVDPEDFGYYYSPTLQLHFDEFKKFIYLYFFDLAHDELHCPTLKADMDQSIYDIIQFGRIQIENIMKQINFLDEIIVRWC